jgi:hypothetical protein
MGRSLAVIAAPLPGTRKNMKNSHLVISLLAIALVQPALSTADADLAPLKLLCKASFQGQLLTQNLVVDYGRKTVNGVPASITDAMITWSSKELDSYRRQDAVMKHELNRLSGTYRFWQEGAVYAAAPPTYACEKAPPPKF